MRAVAVQKTGEKKGDDRLMEVLAAHALPGIFDRNVALAEGQPLHEVVRGRLGMLTFIHERRFLAVTILAEADAGLGALLSIFVRWRSKRLATDLLNPSVHLL